MGGLDANSSCGKTAPYYSNALYEVIWHCTTRIPTVDSDPQQIQKVTLLYIAPTHSFTEKAHWQWFSSCECRVIDGWHIDGSWQVVWSEHLRDYNPNTITSQFNDAHIIIYPLPNGLYRIQIHKKDKVYPSNMSCNHLVTGAILRTVVRRDDGQQE